MSRLTATAAMILCCAGAAFAQQTQTTQKSCCADKSDQTAQTVAQQTTQAADKSCSTGATCPITGAAQTVAVTVATTEAADGKQCCADKAAQTAAQTVAMQTAQTADGKQCCASKGEAAAQQVALVDGQSCQTACSDAQTAGQTAGQIASGCSIEGKLALAADLPAMQRKVGDEVTSCPVKAGELSQASGQPVIYLVGQQSFEDANQATEAYAAELTSYLDKATRVTFAVDGECIPCPDAASKACSAEGKTMTYRVAGRDFTSAEAAVRAAAMAYGASRQVNLNYEVGGECAGSCEKTAAEMSMATAQPVVYRVGDKETRCDVQASVMLAIARIEAAVTAVQAVPQS